jgi:hypothetical protein
VTKVHASFQQLAHREGWQSHCFQSFSGYASADEVTPPIGRAPERGLSGFLPGSARTRMRFQARLKYRSPKAKTSV